MSMKNEKVNKKDYAYNVIRARILDGIYGPGQRIVIDQISKELNLSIIPVREAIRQLEADGLIHNKPYSGPVVNSINEKEYLETLSVLAVLEGYATALSGVNMTDETILQLKQINSQMRDALEEFDFEMFGNLNRQFHVTILDKSGNCYLLDEIRRVWERMDSVRKSVFTLLPARTKHSVIEHDALIELLETRASFTEVEQYARGHKMNTVKAFEKREGKRAENQENQVKK